jgi:hypothetical protein
MTVAINYPNGFAITTFDDGSHDGWYYAPDTGTTVRFADYAGGTNGEGDVITSADGNVLIVKIKTSKIGDSPAIWHGYANVNGNQVWIETDAYQPQGEVAFGTSVDVTTEVLDDLIAISVNPLSLDFGKVYRGQSSAEFSMEITNTGTVSVDVSASTESAFYQESLTLDGTTIDEWGETIPSGSTSISAQVNVPSDWDAGIESGTIIFWAEATS